MGMLIILGALVLAVVFGVVWGLSERSPSKGYRQSGGGFDTLDTYIVADTLSDLFDD